jgi:hypothetical protein
MWRPARPGRIVEELIVAVLESGSSWPTEYDCER